MIWKKYRLTRSRLRYCSCWDTPKQTYARVKCWVLTLKTRASLDIPQSRVQSSLLQIQVQSVGKAFFKLWAVKWMVRKELLVLIVLCDRTMLVELNQSFSGSRWHFVCACMCVWCVIVVNIVPFSSVCRWLTATTWSPIQIRCGSWWARTRPL